MSIITKIVNDIVSEHYIYLSNCEEDSTKIEKSIAVLKVRNSELQANRELAECYFNMQIKEKERLFNSASKVLEKAIEKGNVEVAQIALRSIEIVHKKSPFSF